MQVKVVNTKGEPVGKINLPEEMFVATGNLKLLSLAIRIYLSNKRRAQARAKTRGEVRGSGRKIWRQKGTGRARHGDAQAPIFVGGGVAHGPTGKENYKMEFPKSLRRKALLFALSQKLEKKELVVVDGLEEVEPKTSKIKKILKKVAGDVNRISIIVPEGNHSIIRGARNVKGMHLLSVKSLNAYDILTGGMMVVPKSALPSMEEIYTGTTEKSGGKQSRKKQEIQAFKPERIEKAVRRTKQGKNPRNTKKRETGQKRQGRKTRS